MPDIEIINIDLGMNVEEEIKRVADSIADSDVRREMINRINLREPVQTKKEIEKRQWDQKLTAIYNTLKNMVTDGKFVPMEAILLESKQVIQESELSKLSKKLDEFVKNNGEGFSLIKRKSNGRMIYSLQK